MEGEEEGEGIEVRGEVRERGEVRGDGASRNSYNTHTCK